MGAAYVERLARRWIWGRWLGTLGEVNATNLAIAMRQHQAGNPSVLILALCRSCELSNMESERVAVAAHMLYCSVGLVDDIQDGDAQAYLDMSMPEQLNVALALRELGVNVLTEVLSPPKMVLVLRALTEATVRMTVSQAEELQKSQENWDIAAFERVARDAAGAEFGFLLYLIGMAIGAHQDTLRAAGEAMGIMFQIKRDLSTGDTRATDLDKWLLDGLYERTEENLKEHVANLPSAIGDVLIRSL